MSTLDSLPEADREALFALPDHIFRLVAAADGAVDAAEAERHLNRLTHLDWCDSMLFAEIAAGARKRHAEGATPGADLGRGARCDAIKLGLIALDGLDDVDGARADLLRLGEAVASASGGFAGFVGPVDRSERRALRLLDQLLKVRWAPPGPPPESLDDDRLAALRALTDPLAEQTIAPFLSGAIDRAELDAALAALPGKPPPSTTENSPLDAYFRASARMPFWADCELIVAGQALFVRHAPLVTLSLFTAALPRMYTLREGVKVLAMSERLSSHTGRRIIETAQFLIDVLTPGELLDGGRGLHTLQKVRLVHAAVRHYAAKSPKWDPAWGQPINQQDQLSVALQLSVGLLDGMRRLGVDFTADEVHAFVHAWCVIGAMLGVDDRWMPHTGPEAEALWRRLTDVQQGATPEGKRLTGQLLDYMQALLGGLNLSRAAAEALIVESIGPDAAEMLGVETSAWRRRALAPIKALSVIGDRLGDRSPLVGKLQGRLGAALLRRLVEFNSQGQAVEFVVPEALVSGRAG